VWCPTPQQAQRHNLHHSQDYPRIFELHEAEATVLFRKEITPLVEQTGHSATVDVDGRMRCNVQDMRDFCFPRVDFVSTISPKYLIKRENRHNLCDTRAEGTGKNRFFEQKSGKRWLQGLQTFEVHYSINCNYSLFM